MGNTFKTAFLLTVLTLLLMGIGRAFGGQNGMLLALGVAAVTNFVAYFFSDKIALATYRAQPVTRDQLPRVYEVVERMTQRIGLPMPRIYVIPTDPACGLAFPRISGRRHRRALHRQSVCFGERVSETRCLLQARAVSGDAIHCSSLYYSAVPGHELRQLVLDPSSDC